MNKKTFWLLILICCFSFQNSFGGNLRAYLSYASFNSPDGPYLETYLGIDAGSMKLIPAENGKYQGTVEITMLFKQDGTIKEYKKYEFKSPLFNDTLNIRMGLIDLQRYALPNGTYDFDIIISDQNSKADPFLVSNPITINYPYDKASLSGIELVESYKKTESQNILSKSGFDLVPFVENFYPENISKLTYYSEVYNMPEEIGTDEKFIVIHYIESYENQQQLNNFVKVKRVVAKPVIVLFNEFDISKLASGNYNLVIEIRDKQNQLITSNKLFFQRSNPNIQLDLKDLAALDIKYTFAGQITERDSLVKFIHYLDPISTEIERFFVKQNIKQAELLTLQQYFLNFWLTRNQLDPHNAWMDYKEQVKKANLAFSTTSLKGFETDRGHVFLKYGPPNAIAESHHEPSAYPYEIWHYYQLKSQRNRKFVFATQDLITNDFRLIHSDAIGELNNYRWQIEISRRQWNPSNLDESQARDHWGSNINDYFNNPR